MMEGNKRKIYTFINLLCNIFQKDLESFEKI